MKVKDRRRAGMDQDMKMLAKQLALRLGELERQIEGRTVPGAQEEVEAFRDRIGALRMYLRNL